MIQISPYFIMYYGVPRLKFVHAGCLVLVIIYSFIYNFSALWVCANQAISLVEVGRLIEKLCTLDHLHMVDENITKVEYSSQYIVHLIHISDHMG